VKIVNFLERGMEKEEKRREGGECLAEVNKLD
jgi:hypothetical protein